MAPCAEIHRFFPVLILGLLKVPSNHILVSIAGIKDLNSFGAMNDFLVVWVIWRIVLPSYGDYFISQFFRILELEPPKISWFMYSLEV